jgi:hypothetical protein
MCDNNIDNSNEILEYIGIYIINILSLMLVKNKWNIIEYLVLFLNLLFFLIICLI